MEIRNAIIYASYEFFDKMDSLNSIVQFFQEMRQKILQNYSKRITLVNQHFLTQSGQLYLEAGAMAFGRVFELWASIPCRKI